MNEFHPPSKQTGNCELYPRHPIIHTLDMLPPEGLAGICPVCGRPSQFLDFNENLRESGFSSVSHSTNRQRQMAWMLRRRLHLPPVGRMEFAPDVAIYNVESNGPLHLELCRHPNYVCSEYFGPEHASGSLINGIRHEDLQHLSFADASFDLVLSSDVLEHMPNPYDAHREIWRVLKPGGRHIFTVPFNPGITDDDIRARLVDGHIEYLAEPAYHGDPVRPGEGILVWTIFGTGMMQRLEEIGFAASAWNLYAPEYGIIGAGNIVFEARKPPLSKVTMAWRPPA